jgi:hypothetical protein
VWLIALRKEAVSISVTSVNFCQTTRRNIPEESHRHTLRRENLISHHLQLCSFVGMCLSLSLFVSLNTGWFSATLSLVNGFICHVFSNYYTDSKWTERYIRFRYTYYYCYHYYYYYCVVILFSLTGTMQDRSM